MRLAGSFVERKPELTSMENITKKRDTFPEINLNIKTVRFEGGMQLCSDVKVSYPSPLLQKNQ